jgi:hypothetical protein
MEYVALPDGARTLRLTPDGVKAYNGMITLFYTGLVKDICWLEIKYDSGV